MNEKKWHKFPVLFSLYIAQSVPMSFFSTVVPVIMRQEHYSLEAIGLMQLVKLPWILKFLWAPLVDRNAATSRQLKRWIFLSEIFYALVIVSISYFSLQVDFKLIVALMVVAFCASATQDIATDNFAIRILSVGERGPGNGLQSAGSFIGSLLGTGVLLIAYHYFGWQVLLWLLAAFVLLALLPVGLYKQPVNPYPEIRRKVSFTDIFSFFRAKGMVKQVLVLLFYYSGIIGILAMLKPWMVDLGYSVKEIGFMSGIVGTSVAASAALGAGFLLRTIGRRRAIFLFLSLSVMASLYFWLISLGTPTKAMLYVGICWLWGAYGLSTVVIYTTSMDRVRSGSEGTDFTIQIVITHLSGLIMAIVSGKIADAFGYSGLFATEIFFGLTAAIFVLIAYGKKDSMPQPVDSQPLN
jgi:predicted MFS family arabinose efflux permease